MRSLAQHRIFFLAALSAIFFSSHAFAGSLELRKSLTVTWPENAKYSVNYLGAEPGYWLVKKGQVDSADHATVVLAKEAIPVNEKIARLDWEQFIKNEDKLGIKTTDFGCITLKKHRFSCSRTAVTDSGRFIAEQHIFTEDRDIVMLRVTSKDSAEQVQNELKTFQLHLAATKP